jgi:putative ABC transport system permease protein
MVGEQTWHDLRRAWRDLRRARGVALPSVLMLAVGIAGTTVMFTLVQGVLLRPLPVREPERLVGGWKELRAVGGMAHYPYENTEIDSLARTSRALESVAGVSYNGVWHTLVFENGAPGYIDIMCVSGEFFRVLGVAPVLGRVLDPSDDVEGAEGALVITHALWQRRYGGSREVLGRRIVSGERPFTIVGVMPPDVEFPSGVEAWNTLHAVAATLTNPAFREGMLRDLDLFARLRPGFTLAQAAAELQAATTAFEATAPPGTSRGQRPVIRTYEDMVTGDVRTPLAVLFGAVSLVLLIATANVANLLLLRGEARRPELAVRAALGATWGRLARQALAESLVLSLAAGTLALAASRAMLGGLIALLPDRLPRPDSVHVDAGVLLFTIAVAFLAASLAGLAPALSSARLDVVAHLRGGGRGTTPRAARTGRQALVVAQVMLAVVVVTGAALLSRTVLRLQTADMGFAADRLALVVMDLPLAKYGDDTRHRQFLDAAVARLEAAPDVLGATPVNTEPFAGTGGWDSPSFTAEGQTFEEAAANPSLNLESVHPGYFKTLGVTIARGREFTDRDRAGATEVAVVSEDVAARLWPGQDPIGRRLKFGNPTSDETWRTVVGVARPTRYRELTHPRPTLYVPANQFIAAATTLVLRTAEPVGRVAEIARRSLHALDPDVTVLRVLPFAEALDKPLARPRFNAYLIGVFAGAALLLATIGVYAVIAASVRQRYAEIGVRVALGATRADVRRLVLGEGVRLAALGAAMGAGGALLAGRLVQELLYEVQPHDPLSLAGAAALLVAVAALASYLPARRAVRLDVMATLREE